MRENGSKILSDEMRDIVVDYVLSYPEILSKNERSLLMYALNDFDKGMMGLRKYVKYEPDYHKNLIPWEIQERKIDEKMKARFKKSEKDILKRLLSGLESGRITQGEYDEYLELDEERDAYYDIDKIIRSVEADPDDFDAFDAEMERKIKEAGKIKHKMLERRLEILCKAGE